MTRIRGTSIHVYLRNDPNNPNTPAVQNRPLRTTPHLPGAPKPPKTLDDFSSRPRTVLGVTFARTHPNWQNRTAPVGPGPARVQLPPGTGDGRLALNIDTSFQSAQQAGNNVVEQLVKDATDPKVEQAAKEAQASLAALATLQPVERIAAKHISKGEVEVKLPPTYRHDPAHELAATAEAEKRNAAMKIMRFLKRKKEGLDPAAKALGDATRGMVSVKAVAEGIVHVSVRGNAEAFSAIGMEAIDFENGPKALNYLSISSQKFKAYAAGGDALHRTRQMTGTEVRDVLREKDDTPVPPPLASAYAYVNGSFYNTNSIDKRTSYAHERHAAIGEVIVKGSDTPPCVNPPLTYRDQYRSIEFSNGSKITAAPVLSENGEVKFKHENLEQAKYQFSPTTNSPGRLGHASHPNPRSGISTPSDLGASDKGVSNDRSRIAVCQSTGRGATATGFTMPEWAHTMARLDKLNEGPSRSLNLDGGDSTVIGVVNAAGEKVLEILQSQFGRSANFIAFAAKSHSAEEVESPTAPITPQELS